MLIAFTSLLMTAMTAQVAQAQTQASRLPTWAVLDFDNQTSYGGADIGREAGDAMVLELGRTNKYFISNRSDVEQGLTSLGLTPPLDTVDAQRLGHQINADAVVSGDVLSITKTDNPAQVQAVIVVRVTNCGTGELINGALAQGSSTPRNGPAPDQDTLVNEAISKAAFAAVRQIASFNVPAPTILNNEGPSTVLLNLGSRDGLQPGQKFLVQRNGLEVGRLSITHVEDDSSEANVDSTNIGVRPGDRAHLIYQLPPYEVRGGRVITDSGNLATGSAVQAQHKNSIGSSVGGIILAILAAGIIVALVNRGGHNNSLGGGSNGGITAQVGYGPEVGLNYESALSGYSLGSTPDDPNSPGYGVRVSWSTGNLNPTAIVGFNIYRGNAVSFDTYLSGGGSSSSTTAGTGSTSATATATGTTGTTTTTVPFFFNEGPVLAVDSTTRSVVDPGAQKSGLIFFFVEDSGAVSPSSTTGSSSGSTTTGSTGSTGSTSGSNAGTTAGQTAGGGGVTPVQVGNTLGTATLTGSGFEQDRGLPLGQSTTYEVTAIYSVTQFAGGTERTGYEETPVQSSVSGLVTPLLPIDVTGQGNTSGDSSNNVKVNNANAYQATGVNFSSVVISFLSNAGADSYVVDVATTPNFSNKVVLSPNPISTIVNGGLPLQTNTVNLRTIFPGATQIYYRIGERNSTDSPGPVRDDALYPNPDLYGRSNAGWIYSLTGFFSGA